MTPPQVTVVIVTWNRWADTAACLESIRADGYAPLRVVVVDNGSAQPAGPRLGEGDPPIALVRSPVNLGFAGGANLGIAHALTGRTDYLLLLNNDMRIDRGCIAALVALAEAHPACGIVGPKILYADAPTRIWFAGARRGRLSLSAGGWGRRAPDGPRFQRVRQVGYLCAGAMLVRPALLHQVGMFDPGYFMYYEDCEFCLRAAAAGYTLWYTPAARVWHTVAASTGGEGSPAESYYRAVSVFRFVRRNSRGLHRAILLALRVAILLARIALALARRRRPVARALWRGLCAWLAGQPGREAPCDSW